MTRQVRLMTNPNQKYDAVRFIFRCPLFLFLSSRWPFPRASGSNHAVGRHGPAGSEVLQMEDLIRPLGSTGRECGSHGLLKLRGISLGPQVDEQSADVDWLGQPVREQGRIGGADQIRCGQLIGVALN